MNDIQDLTGLHRSLDLLDRGVVNASATTISLLGIDLLGIRQIKVMTTIDTWLTCGELLL